MSTEKKPLHEDESSVGVIQQNVEVVGQWGVLAQVADACDLPRAELTDAATRGAVWLQKKVGSNADKKHYRNPVRLRDFEQPIDAGDLVLVNYNPSVLAAEPMLPVLVSDEVNYSVWDKPSGMLSQGSRWGDHTTVTFQAEKLSGKKSLLVHRLDRAASGLIVIAHTRNAVVALTELFASRKVEKTYSATVHGEYREILPQVIELPVNDKPAHTEIIAAQVVGPEENSAGETQHATTRLTVRIITGRKHQIRSHLSSAGFPVVGDRLFDPEKDHQQDLQLTCIGLKFECPFTNVAKSFAL